MQKINIECIRDILKYLIENLTIEIEEDMNRFSYLKITTHELVKNLISDSYTKEDIVYCVNILAECNFINGYRLCDKASVYLANQEITSITYAGQNFYESIKPEDIWDKTKGIAQKIGIHTLDFVETVAHDMAVESAKQAITMAMSK